MSEPKRVSFDLPLPERIPPRPRHCSGALLLVTRAEYDTYMRDAGVQFATSRKWISESGKLPCRVHCGLEMRVDEKVRHPMDGDGNRVELPADASLGVQRTAYGLCRSCSELEANHRAALVAKGSR